MRGRGAPGTTALGGLDAQHAGRTARNHHPAEPWLAPARSGAAVALSRPAAVVDWARFHRSLPTDLVGAGLAAAAALGADRRVYADLQGLRALSHRQPTGRSLLFLGPDRLGLCLADRRLDRRHIRQPCRPVRKSAVPKADHAAGKRVLRPLRGDPSVDRPRRHDRRDRRGDPGLASALVAVPFCRHRGAGALPGTVDCQQHGKVSRSYDRHAVPSSTLAIRDTDHLPIVLGTGDLALDRCNAQPTRALHRELALDLDRNRRHSTALAGYGGDRNGGPAADRSAVLPTSRAHRRRHGLGMTVLPAVTAITIFLNEERFLAEAVESVLAQGFADWELLLVDDGSSDGSSDIARSYALRHPDRIRCLATPRRENRGISGSRNLGLSQARGRHVAFLDADDVWMPGKLAEQCPILDARPDCGMVYGRTLIWRSWNASGEDFLYPLGVEPDAVYAPPRLFELLVENKAQSPTTCNALMRRALIEEVGGFEAGFRRMFEDQAFFAKALLAYPTYVDGRIWAKYRQHPASCSARSEHAGHDRRARARVLRWMRRELRRELAPYPDARERLVRELRRNAVLDLGERARRLLRRRIEA